MSAGNFSCRTIQYIHSFAQFNGGHVSTQNTFSMQSGKHFKCRAGIRNGEFYLSNCCELWMCLCMCVWLAWLPRLVSHPTKNHSQRSQTIYMYIVRIEFRVTLYCLCAQHTIAVCMQNGNDNNNKYLFTSRLHSNVLFRFTSFYF